MIGNLVTTLAVNSKPFAGGIQEARRSISTFASDMRSSLLPVTAAAAGGLIAARSAVQAAREAVAQENKLASVLNATGHAAGLTVTEIKGLASELQSLTNFEDDATVGAAAILATFKEIKGDVFRDAVAAAQDMSAVIGNDLKVSIMQIGKALNDPTQGINALRKAGVSFTDDQRAVIKSLQQTGDMAGAQAIIMRELQSEFGGAARAMADPATQLKHTLGDLSESVGAILLPTVDRVTMGITKWIKENDALSESAGGLGDELADGLLPAIATVTAIAERAAAVFVGLQSGVTGLAADLASLQLLGAKLDAFLGTEGATERVEELTVLVEELERKAAKLGNWADAKLFGGAEKTLSDALNQTREQIQQHRELAQNAKIRPTIGEDGANSTVPNARSSDIGEWVRSFVAPLKDGLIGGVSDAMAELKREADALRESTRTPAEMYQESLLRARKLYDMQLIDPETLRRAVEEARSEFLQTFPEMSDGVSRSRSDDAFSPSLQGSSPGSRESLMDIVARQRGFDTSGDKAAKDAVIRSMKLLEDANRIASQILQQSQRPVVFSI
ncbi:MAG: phage tail length tape measure family protein [Blastocatellales bacterium]